MNDVHCTFVYVVVLQPTTANTVFSVISITVSLASKHSMYAVSELVWLAHGTCPAADLISVS